MDSAFQSDTGIDLAGAANSYWTDWARRSILFLDLLRRRGNEHFVHAERKDPNVLSFDFEVVLDGRTLERPVNYSLVRIIPPENLSFAPDARPFIVFDPRAGHGPGIGGMKRESEIGVAMRAGHPCYFVTFLPDPVPGQTIEDVCRAEALFVKRVAELHAHADGKPCLIANCQAGWQIAMMSAVNPGLSGPIVLAGAPLSYWAGVHGKNPLRYLGGLLGGSWMTSLAGDLGGGIFDGANLVANFESMNPANTFWNKNYHVYANIDTEEERFLEFEKWWGSPVLLSAEEMQFIADELFIGNKLSGGEIFFSDGTRIDLRNITAPIVVFCSWGDDITPPQQALGWVLDLYAGDEDLLNSGQTIVYALHQSIGHLGIFVSARVATKEHDEFTRCMDLIDALPPGLYEAVFTDKGPDTAHAELVSGNYVVAFERRTLADIRALGGNDEEDDRRFATVASLSQTLQGLYRQYASPWVKAMVSPESAAWMRQLHPHRMRFEFFSDRNPMMAGIAALAEAARAAGTEPPAPDNPFLQAQEAMSRRIVENLDAYRDLRDRAKESFFLNFYGSPWLQALAGLRSDYAPVRWRVGRDVAREAAIAVAEASLEARLVEGGAGEAALRALLYVGRSRPGADERSFEALRAWRRAQPDRKGLDVTAFREMVRDQAWLLRHDEDRAVAAIPRLLESVDAAERERLLGVIRTVAEAAGPLPAEGAHRLSRVESLFIQGVEPALAKRSRTRNPAA